MGKLELAQIKTILQNTSYEIITVQKEAARDHDNISNLKIEKLKKLFDESEKALLELKSLNVTLKPKIASSEIQNVIENILKARANKGPINPAVLQAILSSLQNINTNLGEIRIDEEGSKLGKKAEKTHNEQFKR